jgi:hypothetical protein
MIARIVLAFFLGVVLMAATKYYGTLIPSGSTTTVGTVSGTLTSGNLVKSDASHNLVDAGQAPGDDPCFTGVKTTKAFSNAGASTNLKLVSLSGSLVTYICSINVGPVAGAVNVALVSGTKVTNECDTGAAGLAGGATAATGWNFAANGGIAFGSGIGTVTNDAGGKDICLLFSGAVQVGGVITYLQQ